MFHYRDGNIFDIHDTRRKEMPVTVAVTVNTVGVMGKGVALQFKKLYPELFDVYKRDLDRGILKIGRPTLAGRHNEFMFFPTKMHWRNDSKLEWIIDGLKFVRHSMGGLFYNLALPPLGCGNGNLNWLEVEQQILNILDVHYNVYIYPPNEYLHTRQPNVSDEEDLANWVMGGLF